MARKARKLTEIGFYHVIMRGNNQQELFYDDDDRNYFISKLEKYVKELKITLHTYTLMNNHIHLEISNATKSMAKLVKKLACSYVPYFNKKYKRTGHLFQGRYISIPIFDEQQFMDIAAYIINNPEQAGYCRHNKYKWSSFRYYFDKNSNQDFVYSKLLLDIAGSKKKLKEFFKTGWKKIHQDDHYNPILHNDDLVILFIKQLLNIDNLLSVCKLDFERKNAYLKTVLNTGLPVNQISRLTGVPRGLLYRLK
ncbi:MAG: transposase [Treponema sp.]|nr:transposase [Treponema sp.]